MSWMKRVSILLVAALLLVSCGARTTNNDSVVPTEGENSESSVSGDRNTQKLKTDYAEDALSPVAQLALGTIMLEDTEHPVDSDMAAELLPYWQLYLNMMNSDTAAQQEQDSLIADIQTVMDEDQMNYIAGLELTQEDLMSMGTQLNLADRTSVQDGENSDTGSTRQNGRGVPPDGMPEGLGPGDGGFGGGPGGGQDGQAVDPELMATMQAQRGDFGGVGSGLGANRMLQPLIQALIDLLESKTAS